MSQQTQELDRLEKSLGSHAWAAAVVSNGDIVTRTHDVPPEGHLEIGSISKGFTGLLYADALERRLLKADDRLSQHLDVTGPVADVPLALLATHHSGLPRLASGDVWARSMRHLVKAENPYGDTLHELLAQASQTKVGRPGPMYSNLGFQLLGHAVASASGLPYRDLLHDRIAGPLGLDSLHVPYTLDDVRPYAVVGRTRFGRRSEPWTGEAVAPAGGIRASIDDMARWVQALLDGSVVGTAALDPIDDFVGGMRIGAAWITTARPKRITWHNGGTGGFRSFVGIDRERGIGAVILNGRAASVDRAGMRLLA